MNLKKRYFGSYSLDVISSCCFGVTIDSTKEPNNELLKIFQKLTTRTPRQVFAVLLFGNYTDKKILIH